jgi:hypothetical protein
MDGPVDPAAAEQRGVRRVDDRVDLLQSDVAGDQFGAHGVTISQCSAANTGHPCSGLGTIR